MHSKTINNLHNKILSMPFLLAIVAAIFLSACGIKGDLYQTPEQAETPTASMTMPSESSETKSNAQPPIVQKTTPTEEQGKEQQ